MAADSFTFEEFWRLLDEHRDCIETVATDDAVFYDLGERVAGFHWHPAVEEDGEERLCAIEVHAAHDLLGAVYVRPMDVGGVHKSEEPAGDAEDESEGVRYEVHSNEVPPEILLAVTFTHDLAEEHEETHLQN